MSQVNDSMAKHREELGKKIQASIEELQNVSSDYVLGDAVQLALDNAIDIFKSLQAGILLDIIADAGHNVQRMVEACDRQDAYAEPEQHAPVVPTGTSLNALNIYNRLTIPATGNIVSPAEVIALIDRIRGTRGWENLGNPEYVVVRHPEHIDEDVIDSIRGFLMTYASGAADAKSLRTNAACRGDLAMNVIPDWFGKMKGHVTKGGFASLLYHVMVMAQLDPSFKERRHTTVRQHMELERQLEAGEIPSIKIPKSLQQ